MEHKFSENDATIHTFFCILQTKPTSMSKILSLFKNEYDLARAISKKDTKAQTALYDKYAAKMLAICMRYVGDKMEAEDVMIEGFMKIFDKINQFNYQGSFEGWMKRIMVNEALMKLRSKKTVEVEIDEVRYLEADSSITTTLNTQDLMQLINELPVGYRTVFNLYAIEGYSHAEIGEMLGISEGTSKSQLSRARAFLQERIREMENVDAKNS